MWTPRKVAAACMTLCAALVLACDGTGSTSPDDDVLRLILMAGDAQVGEAGKVLPAPLQVRVVDKNQRPVSGVRVLWVANLGATTPGSSVTDAAGEAKTTHTLGYSAGPERVTASIDNDSVSFAMTALVQGAMQMALTTGDHGDRQRDSVQATLLPYKVVVLDHKSVPVPGVEVRWAVFGGGSLSSDATRTDANGVAQVTHTLGTATGSVPVMAFVQGLTGSPITFRAEVTPGAPVRAIRFEGDGQVGLIGSRLTPYRIRSSDVHGNVVTDTIRLTIDWAVTAGLGSVTAITPGAATHTLGALDGPQTVVASFRNAPHLTPLEFTSRAVTEIVGVDAGYYYYYYCYFDAAGFEPQHATVPSGRSVGWVWFSSCNTEHSITFEDDPAPPLSSNLLAAGKHVRTFTGPPRVIRYRCLRHSTSFTSGMVGTVTIL